MGTHGSFSFKKTDDLLKTAESLGISLPYQEDINPLFEEISIGSEVVPNRFAVQPMEGFDAQEDGMPGELCFRRYERFARGGSGLIWFEATSVVSVGRSNPRQLMISPGTLDGFKRLVEKTRNSAAEEFGPSHRIYLVLQLTHSGRYSKPNGYPSPRAGAANPFLDRVPDPTYIVSDEELKRLQDVFVTASHLALEAGFDAVDVKACHGYLIHDLLSAHLRGNSRFGGSFENRIRFLREVNERISADVPLLKTAPRINAYDGLPFPHGFGVSAEGGIEPDLHEPIELLRILISSGCNLFNITVGNPYLNPHLGRPYDRAVGGRENAVEHPLVSLNRLLEISGRLQSEFAEVPFVGTGYSWFRQFFPYIGAGMVAKGRTALVGLGRSSFAYPDAPKDLMATGSLNPKKVCITCSRCTELLRAGRVGGCVIRDKEIYALEYKSDE